MAPARPEVAVADRIRIAPDAPGVYLMRDPDGAVLYVGKALSLRARLRSYLDPLRQGPKTEHLMRLAAALEWFVTDTEVEALILEDSLIKQNRPRFNISLRDDKTYPLLRLSIQEEFPALTVVRRPVRDGAAYFGPFIPAASMHATVRLLRRIFPLRLCRRFRPGRRPCLNHQIGRCLAPCAGRIGAAEYGELVRGVSLFLQGKGAAIAAELRRRMGEASREQRYEEAALLRDQAADIEAVLERQKVHDPVGEDLDVAGLVRLGERVGVSLLHVREGRLIGTEAFTFRDPMAGEGQESALEVFLRDCYGGEREIPSLIVVPEPVPGAEVIAAWLDARRGAKVRLVVPKTGGKKALLLMAARNAMRLLQEEKAGASGGDALLEELGRMTGTGGMLRSLAAMDVSNLSGTDAVASLVWWEGGGLRRQRYRRFRIRRAGAPDDFAMLGEVAGRLAARVAAGAWPGPDVLMLDGGRGQLAAGSTALGQAGWRPRLLLSIAKPSEKRGTDAVFAGGGVAALPLEAGSPVLGLLQRVRDEAHRFAVAYHRSLRARRLLKGPLHGVPGLGAARRELLLKTFGSVSGVRAATRGQLEAVVPKRVAGAVREALHPEEAERA